MLSSVSLDPLSRMEIENSINNALKNAASLEAGYAERAAQAEQERMKDAVNDAVNKSTDSIRSDISTFKKDILEKSGDLGKMIAELSTDLGDGFCRIDKSMMVQNQRISKLYSGVDLMRRNLVEGFSAVIDRLEQVQDTLGRIEQKITNPEETLALERYRRARNFLDKGRAAQALATINETIHNKGGPSMGHMPELRYLRGTIHLGLHDKGKESFLNLAAAAEDFEEAIVFAEPAAKDTLREHLALAYWSAGDFEAAMKQHQAIGGLDSRFQIARCLLKMNRTEKARTTLIEVFGRDQSYAVLAAADPVCQSHSRIVQNAASHVQIQIQNAKDAAKRKEEEKQRAEKELREKLLSAVSKSAHHNPAKDLRIARNALVNGTKHLMKAHKFEPMIRALMKEKGIPPEHYKLWLHFNSRPFKELSEKAATLIKEIEEKNPRKYYLSELENYAEANFSAARQALDHLEETYRRVLNAIAEMQTLIYGDGQHFTEACRPRASVELRVPDGALDIPARPHGLIARIAYDRKIGKIRQKIEQNREMVQRTQEKVNELTLTPFWAYFEKECKVPARAHFDQIKPQQDKARQIIDIIQLERGRVQSLSARAS